MSESITLTRVDKDNWFVLNGEAGVIDKMGTDEALHAVTCWAMQRPMPYGGWRSPDAIRRAYAEDLKKRIGHWLESERDGGNYGFNLVEESWRDLAEFISPAQKENDP